jgi:hypothetical protein
MAGSNWITEAQTYYLVSKTGEFVFMQVAFSNLSWPAQTTCGIMTRYFNAAKPEAERMVFRSIHTSASKMKVSHDKTSVEVKGIKFSMSDPKGDFSEIKLFSEDDALKLDINFLPLSKAFSIQDGNIHFGYDKSDGHINLKFIPFAKVTGQISLTGLGEEFDGYGFCVHQFQGVKPYLSASKWNLVYFQSKESEDETKMSAFMIQIKTPSAYDSVTFNIGSIFAGHKQLGVSIGNQIEPQEMYRDPESHYLIPSKFTYTWTGVSFDDEPFKIICDIRPKTLCAKMNVLDNLPFFLRKAIEAFVSRPFAYYWLDEGELDVTIGTNNSKFKGWVMQELSLINEDS